MGTLAFYHNMYHTMKCSAPPALLPTPSNMEDHKTPPLP